jgi:predicted transposase YdaD
MAAQPSLEIVQENTDRISGAKARRAKLEGRHVGRRPLDLDREAILRDHRLGQSLGKIVKERGISRATVRRVVHEPAPTSQEHVA